MTSGQATEISSDDRVMAALAHFLGLFGAFIVWATQKDKSRFVKFQALQSLAFGGLLTVVMMLVMLCLMGVMFLGIMGAVFASSQANASPSSLPSIGVIAMLSPMSFFCVMPVSFAAALVQLIAAFSVATGHNWRYPIIAKRVEAYMGQPADV
jgi:uncharacterized Tic20 family protein